MRNYKKKKYFFVHIEKKHYLCVELHNMRYNLILNIFNNGYTIITKA